jgi:hypothetical protein
MARAHSDSDLDSDLGLRSKNMSVSYVAGLTSIQCPFLTIAGSKDIQITAESVKRVTERLPKCTLLVCGKELGHQDEYG